MQTQPSLPQEQALIADIERLEHLCAWAEAAGRAVVDTYSDMELENAFTAELSEASEETSIWGQVLVWHSK